MHSFSCAIHKGSIVVSQSQSESFAAGGGGEALLLLDIQIHQQQCDRHFSGTAKT